MSDTNYVTHQELDDYTTKVKKTYRKAFWMGWVGGFLTGWIMALIIFVA